MVGPRLWWWLLHEKNGSLFGVQGVRLHCSLIPTNISLRWKARLDEWAKLRKEAEKMSKKICKRVERVNHSVETTIASSWLSTYMMMFIPITPTVCTTFSVSVTNLATGYQIAFVPEESHNNYITTLQRVELQGGGKEGDNLFFLQFPWFVCTPLTKMKVSPSSTISSCDGRTWFNFKFSFLSNKPITLWVTVWMCVCNGRRKMSCKT